MWGVVGEKIKICRGWLTNFSIPPPSQDLKWNSSYGGSPQIWPPHFTSNSICQWKFLRYLRRRPYFLEYFFSTCSYPLNSTSEKITANFPSDTLKSNERENILTRHCQWWQYCKWSGEPGRYFRKLLAFIAWQLCQSLTVVWEPKELEC